MSSFFEVRDQFIKRNPRTTYSPDCVALFVSQSRETQEVFVEGVTVPYQTSDQGNLKDVLKDSNTIYIEYLTPSTFPGGKFPYPTGSNGDPRLVSASYLTGKTGSLRILEIPIENPQERDGYYFFESKKRVPITGILSPFDTPSPTFLKVSFTGPENYYKSDNNPIRTANITRKSNKRILVDRSTSSPNIGQYQNTSVPNNFSVILKYIETKNLYNSGSEIVGTGGVPTFPSASFFSSSLRSFENIDTALFAEIQDSNFSSKAWTNIRYNGVRETKRQVTGNEPALTFREFNGAIYPTGSDATTIKAILDADRNIETIYFVNFANGTSLGTKNPSGSNANLQGGAIPIDAQAGQSGEEVFDAPTANLFTLLYREIGNRLQRIPSSNIYGVDRGGVFVTDENGKVLREL